MDTTSSYLNRPLRPLSQALRERGISVASDAPYKPGDRVLHRRDPRVSWIVDRCEQNSAGTWMVRIGGFGNVTGITPAADLFLAPPGWEDEPYEPAGSVQYGLSEEARKDKLAADAADPLYRADMRLWHRRSIAWADRWLRLVSGNAAAADAISFHQHWLDEMTGADREAAEAVTRTIRYLRSDPMPIRDSLMAALALAIVVFLLVVGGLP